MVYDLHKLLRESLFLLWILGTGGLSGRGEVPRHVSYEDHKRGNLWTVDQAASNVLNVGYTDCIKLN